MRVYRWREQAYRLELVAEPQGKMNERRNSRRYDHFLRSFAMHCQLSVRIAKHGDMKETLRFGHG